MIKEIRTAKLKKLVSKRFPAGSKFRAVILSERETITPEEFRGKIDTWLNLLDLEG